MHGCMYVCMDVCVHVCVYVCMCVYVRTYLCIFCLFEYGLINKNLIAFLVCWLVRWLSNSVIYWLVLWSIDSSVESRTRNANYCVALRSGAAGRLSTTPLGRGRARQVRDEDANPEVRGSIPVACACCCALFDFIAGSA